MSEENRELGARIARLRLSRDMKQAELAYEAGVSHRTLQRLEAGEAIRSDGLLRIIGCLGRLDAVMASLDTETLSPYELLASQGLSVSGLKQQNATVDAPRRRQRVRRPKRSAQPGGAWLQWPEDEP
jgi:transcriptional regulator with XRE-family HTH domain